MIVVEPPEKNIVLSSTFLDVSLWEKWGLHRTFGTRYTPHYHWLFIILIKYISHDSVMIYCTNIMTQSGIVMTTVNPLSIECD